MKVKNHLLTGDGIEYKKSPNHGTKFTEGLQDTIIIHYTAGSSIESSVSTLCNPRTKASAHLVIGREGAIAQLVPFNIIAWHAGKSTYQERAGFNKYSIGIEIDNAGLLTKCNGGYISWFGKEYQGSEVIEAVHRNESTSNYWHRYTEKQISIVYDICDLLIEKYNISSILGHEEISPNRKIDPGPAFPLDKIRDRLLNLDRKEEGSEESIVLRNPGLVTATKLNIRSAPLLSAPTVAPPLPKGTIVDILRESEGWCEVKVELQGWVKKDYLKT